MFEIVSATSFGQMPSGIEQSSELRNLLSRTAFDSFVALLFTGIRCWLDGLSLGWSGFNLFLSLNVG